MEKVKTDRLWVWLLMLLAGAVFAVGINWGLPNDNVKSLLFASASDQDRLGHLGGINMQKDAGAWDDDAHRASDVAQHPLGDRNQPLTVLYNPLVPTDSDIAAKDENFATLSKRYSRLDAEYRANEEDGDLAHRWNDAAAKLNAERDQYLLKNYPQIPPHLAADIPARARIARRYLLYSYQPDEMITFRALARMHPDKNDLDPRMYQYGGLWIYPVGALLKIADAENWVKLVGDPAYYLDHPEQFGRLYIVARAYAALWGMIGVAAVFALLRRLGACRGVAALGCVAFIVTPVVLSLAHEAKPHLPGTVLILLAVLAAANYVRSGKWSWAILASMLCGFAAGMVLSGLVAMVLIPAMPALRRDRSAKLLSITICGAIIMALVYFATNPYVAINLFKNPQVLQSNWQNTSAMYPTGGVVYGALRSVLLVMAGASLPLAVMGVLGAMLLALPKQKPAQTASTASPQTAEWACGIGWMLALMSVVVLIWMFCTGAGKPGEFGRFALLPDVALLIAAFAAIARLIKAEKMRLVLSAVLVLCVIGFGTAYEVAFIRDTRPHTSRTAAAEQLAKIVKDSRANFPLTLLLADEPAPYCLPPVDLYRWKIGLLPHEQTAKDVLHGLEVRPDDTINLIPTATPLTWANKAFITQNHPGGDQ